MNESQVVVSNDDLQNLEIETFQIDEMSDLDSKAPLNIYTSSTCCCG
ncbi:hypothetical protein LXA47_02860 [Massilia sp. P8910]|uniref:Thiazolylpeptide-type bacteriocin n=1 Tax=Massilia antarctica TaxID=2765360 RepID=A0AA48WC07_9BURK|nr:MULTISPECIES: hypothetical protein [Massilia]CUI03093.1 hypothetical protein BN2497_963 [Janthinobacterium sp. CG23_2]MCE3602546.1 hypothetical protein [Massilia antarctica]MCY0914516.1 hypothetical protein [Massilia sp. H27-R4]QPI48757.1 hypothetical protein IV454_25095 [Massilia antarctica]CUU26879.1 hypothetical protein BN3177_963 [Janthinobacterium sp. CG23_2]